MLSRAPSRPSLVPLKYEPYPLGAIKPNGWFRDQISLGGQGLGGNLFYFYRFVKESTWLGGTWEYTPLNEAAPYWYNYIVPLAYTQDEATDGELALELKKQADYFLSYTLSHQAEDGWLGPETTPETRGIWARCLLLQGLVNHALADPSKYDGILDAIYRFVRLTHSMLMDNHRGYIPKKGDVFDLQLFGVARAHELALTLQWLYERTEDAHNCQIIWDVMVKMWEGARLMERDWTIFFGDDFPQEPSVRYKSLNFKHGVNVAQGLRYPAHLYRMEPSDGLAQLCRDAVIKAFKFHGTAAGSISSDEYIGGLSPQRGSELCCTVELMFSLSYLYQLFGDEDFASRVELAAFNALPAGISDDWWSHQYVTQINQPWAREFELAKDEKTPFYDVCRYANVFGLEPEFPCCTLNHPAAFPKLLMNAFLSIPTKASKPSILHAYLVPARLHTDTISINCESNYPFAPCALHYTIQTDRAFNFYIRVPGWATSSSTIELREAGSTSALSIGKFIPNVPKEEDKESLHLVQVPTAGTFEVSVTIEATIQIRKYVNNSVSVFYGPLLYAYEIEHETRTRLPRNYKDQSSDCEELVNVSDLETAKEPWKKFARDHDYLPVGDWNIAIDLDKEMKVIVRQGPWIDDKKRVILDLPSPIWSSGASPVHIEVTAAKVDWPIRNGTAADPADVSSIRVRGSPFSARLVPYGTAKLHIAQFPTVAT